MAANAELAAGDPDDHLVLHRQHRGGVALALGRVAVDRDPFHLAGFRVERDDGGVGLVQENGVVGVGDAAVDRVAAHRPDHVRVLLRLILPDDLAVLRQVERIDNVRERRVHVHHVADNERRALVPAQHTGREAPGDLEIADVVLVDLVERRVARVGVVAGLDRPVRRILHGLHHAVVGEGRQGYRGEEGCDSWRDTPMRHRFLPNASLMLPPAAHPEAQGADRLIRLRIVSATTSD